MTISIDIDLDEIWGDVTDKELLEEVALRDLALSKESVELAEQALEALRRNEIAEAELKLSTALSEASNPNALKKKWSAIAEGKHPFLRMQANSEAGR
jgi:hypothetical protein